MIFSTCPVMPSASGDASHTAPAAGFSGDSGGVVGHLLARADGAEEARRGDGRDRVDPHARSLELAREHDRHGRDPGLRRRVVGLPGVAVEPGFRRGHDDRAVGRLARALRLLAPIAAGEVRRSEVALEVHLDHRVELFLAHVEAHLVAQDPGVADEHVESAERLDAWLIMPSAPVQLEQSS